MKYYNFSFFFFYFIIYSVSAQFTAIPDTNFEEKLIALGIDDIMDNQVLNSNIQVISNLDVSDAGIFNLTGIEGFTNLAILNCNDNELVDLNLGSNTSLEQLYCDNNKLINLDVSKNTFLNYLFCSNNQLASLYLSNNTSLEYLVFFANLLSNIDVSNNIILKYLSSEYNQLESLDVSANIFLQDLLCNDNKISSLDISNNTSLQYLNCSTNEIEYLNISNNPVMQNFYCFNNKLIGLNLKNGANEVLDNFKADNNLNLNCIQVDNVNYSASNSNWIKDAAVFYSIDCATASSSVEFLLKNLTILVHTNKKVEILTPLKISYKIYNLNGQELLKGNSAKYTTILNLNKFSKGLYILLVTHKEMEISKYILMH